MGTITRICVSADHSRRKALSGRNADDKTTAAPSLFSHKGREEITCGMLQRRAETGLDVERIKKNQERIGRQMNDLALAAGGNSNPGWIQTTDSTVYGSFMMCRLTF